MRTSSVWLLASAMVVGVVLSGCGGSDVSSMTASNTGTGTGAGTDTGTPGTGTGSTSLLAAVMSLLGTSSDTAQPAPVDAVEAQTSDTAQPEPVS